ncbi:hypothetical protein Q4I28_000315 [Leishmania naiffi]|uniref:Uncharacterized protein n=1 Tax=Leishmania naiffi TaxID=5678 RepID=A0AAW3CD44_9TRYP
MLRLVGCRLGGRARRRSANALIDAAVNAVLAELRAKTTKAKKLKRIEAPKSSVAVAAPAKRAKELVAPPMDPPSPPADVAAPTKAKASNTKKNLVDTVLSGVNCTLLKHVLSSSSSSSTSTDIPDVARMLRLDYTSVAGKHHLAHLADIFLVNRIHAAVVADTQESVVDSKTSAAADSSSPLVVLVETNLPREDAEVQEFIIRNALHMHPLTPEVEAVDGQPIKTPPLTVLVLSDEQTQRVRTLAKLPPLPPRVPSAVPVAIVPATNCNNSAQVASAKTASAQAPSAQASSAKTASAEVPSAQVASAKSTSAKTASAQAPSAQASSAKTASAEVPSAQVASAKSTSAKTASAQAPSAQAASAKTASAQAPSAKTASAQAPSAQASSAKTASAQAPSAQAASTKTASAQVPSAQVASARTASAEVPSAQVASAKSTSAVPASDAATAETASSKKPIRQAQSSPDATPAQDASQCTGKSEEAAKSAPQQTDADETAKTEKTVLPSVSPPPLSGAATAAGPTHTAKSEAQAAVKAVPLEKTEASTMEKTQIERMVRRAARISIKALATQQKKRRPATPSQSRLVAAIAATVSRSGTAVVRPPRLLPVESSKEKLLWASQPGQPLPIGVLKPLVSAAVYEEIRTSAAAAASATSATSPLTMHTVVYSATKESSAATVWLGALQAAADLASAVSGGASQLPAEVAELAGLDPARVRRVSERKSSKQRGATNAAAASSVAADGVAATPTVVTPTSPSPYIYMLIHTRLSREDAAVLQQELQYHLTQLKATRAGAELAGMSVLTADDASPAHLSYVLENTVVEVGGKSAKKSGARRDGKAVTIPSVPPMLSAEGAEVQGVFQEVYRLLSEQPWLLRSPLWTGTPSSSPHQHQQHPDTLVADAIRVTALTQVLVQRKEAQLRQHFEAAQQSSAVNANSEAVARAAQRVEMKSMVTAAVEEVSVRHEQATAHLVKTLSSMAGQWSLEKLSDTLEAIVRDEVKPIMDALEERLGGASSHNSVAANIEATPITAAPTLMATSAFTPSTDSADPSSPVLLAKHDEIKDTMSQVLVQLRELTERMSALAAATTATAAAQTEGSVDSSAVRPSETAAALPRGEEEARLLRDLHELQEKHHLRLSEELECLRNELHTFSRQESATAETPASAPVLTYATALSPESLNGAVADTVHEIAHVIRQGIHTSVVEQLSAYCDVHRSIQSSTRDDKCSEEPLMPVLPVTSFELEEMLTRVVDHAVQKSTEKMESHVREVLEKSQRNERSVNQASSATAAPPTSGTELDEALRGALGGLWAQARAEAAGEEAAKVSQHHRQLLRLFRRQQHLQRGVPGQQSLAAPTSPLSYVALEEAMRVVMHPYMAQMQATVAAAASAAAAASGSPRTSIETSSSVSSNDDGVEQEAVDCPAGKEGSNKESRKAA